MTQRDECLELSSRSGDGDDLAVFYGHTTLAQEECVWVGEQASCTRSWEDSLGWVGGGGCLQRHRRGGPLTETAPGRQPGGARASDSDGFGSSAGGGASGSGRRGMTTRKKTIIFTFLDEGTSKLNKLKNDHLLLKYHHPIHLTTL